MGSFKLGSNRPDVLKENGFLNKSPFTSSGNTMAYANGEGDKKPVKGDQKKADEKANTEAKANMKVVKTETKKEDGGTRTTEYLEGEGKGKTYKEAGVDPAAAQAYWDANPDKYKEYKASQKLKDQRTSFVKDPDEEPTERKIITTSESPRKEKTQDYITGEGDKVFAAPQTQRFLKLSKALTGKADSFGFRNMNKKEVQPYKDAYDKKVLASRAKKEKFGAQQLTIAEQKAKKNINQLGGGRSEIVDTKSGKGQTNTNQNIVKDAQGNMMVQTFNKRGKVISTEPLSPNNDLAPEQKQNKANATNLSGRETVVTTSKV